MKRRRRARSEARVRAPEDQSPFFFVPGKHGGWFISLTWNFGAAVTVAWDELRRLIASSKGDVVIARKLVGNELKLLADGHADIEHEVHARVICREAVRWRRARGR